MWLIFAILSAACASLMTIFMKIGLKDINPFLATAIRTSLVVVLCWLLVMINNPFKNNISINSKTWLFLVLAAIATFGTWTFYFLALKKGTVNNVITIDRLSIVLTVVLSAIFLKEKITFKAICGLVAIIIGSILVIYK